MRVLVISPSYPPAIDGEAEHGRQIAERLARKGYQVQLLTTQRAGLAPPLGFELQACMPGWRWRDLPRLLGRLRAFKPTACVLIFTARLYGEHPMITFLPSWCRWFQPAARVLCLVEVERPPAYQAWQVRWPRKLVAWLAGGRVDYGYGTLLRDTAAVAALGPSILKGLERHEPGLAARAEVVPPPPLLSRPATYDPASRAARRLQLGVQPDELLLAYFGYVYPGKGVETLIGSLALLQAQGLRPRLLMAGGGRGAGQAQPAAEFEARMRALAEAQGVGGLLLWQAGYASGSDEAAHDLLAADLAVLPFDDGAELRRSSIAVVAALGLPLVTTIPAGQETAFEHGRNVWLVPPGNPQALCEAVQSLAQQPALQARLAAGGLELAERWFSWEVLIRALERLLGARQAP